MIHYLFAITMKFSRLSNFAFTFFKFILNKRETTCKKTENA